MAMTDCVLSDVDFLTTPSHELQIDVVFVTPDIARKWLKRNVCNRDLRLYHVDELAKQILRGNYKLTSETIGFNAAGELIDGQHRLHAIVKAGIGIKLIVVRNVDPESYPFIDKGLPRQTQDTFQYQQLKNYRQCAQCMSAILEYLYRVIGKSYRRNRRVVSDFEQLEFIRRYPIIEATVSFATHTKQNGQLIPVGKLAALAFLSSFTPGFDWREYWGKIIQGIDLRHDSGARSLYQSLAASLGSSKRNKLDPEVKYALSIMAFNRDLSGERVSFLRYSYSSAWPRMTNAPHDQLLAFFRLDENFDEGFDD